MPVVTLHLVALHPTSSPTQFVSYARGLHPAPLVLSRVLRWIITPTALSVPPLLTHPWDFLLILPTTYKPLPLALRPYTHSSYTIQAGVPSALLRDWPATQHALLHPAPADVPKLAATATATPTSSTATATATATAPLPAAAAREAHSASAQDLELTQELHAWMQHWDPAGERGAVSMLNLLAFRPGMHAEYLRYGKAFAESIGARRGGRAKLVGRVVGGLGAGAGGSGCGGGGADGGAEHDGAEDGWDEVALAHYPSVWHFAEMLAADDYQEVNRRYRLGSLRDTCILATSELAVLDEGGGGGGGSAKL